MLCRYAFSITQDKADAEDIVQLAFVKLWELRETLEIQHSIKAYLYRIVYTRCLNYLRDNRAKVATQPINDEVLQHGHDIQPGAETELQQRLAKALTALPTECRRVFELSRFESLKYREIAEQLNISIKTVEAQMGKALRILRTELSDYLVTLLLLSLGSTWQYATFFHTLAWMA